MDREEINPITTGIERIKMDRKVTKHIQMLCIERTTRTNQQLFTVPPEAPRRRGRLRRARNDKKEVLTGVRDFLEDSSLSCAMPPGTPNPPTLAPLRPSYVGVARVDRI